MASRCRDDLWLFLTKFYKNKPLKEKFPAYAAVAEKKSLNLKKANLRVIKSIYQRVKALLEETQEGAAFGDKFTAGTAGPASATDPSGINISNIMPEYRPRRPVFKLMSRPNFLACRPAGIPAYAGTAHRVDELGLNLNKFKGIQALGKDAKDEAPHLALKESNPFSLFSEASAGWDGVRPASLATQKDLRKNPIFSLPNPYNLASEKFFKLSGWQGVLGNVAQQLTDTDTVGGSAIRTAAAQPSYAGASAEGESKIGNTDTASVPVKKKKHGLNTEILEFVKSLKNKLTDGFVDSFQKYDLYHK